MGVLNRKFHLPDALNAATPPEKRGVRRDHVKMMVLNKTTGQTIDDSFYNIEHYLQKGDVLVLNNSRTIPAVLKTMTNVEVRLARRHNDCIWDALVIDDPLIIGDYLYFSTTLRAKIIGHATQTPLVTIQFSKSGSELLEDIYSIGEPIRYEYIKTPWELDYYQTVFSSIPGSVEMASAGRAFSWELLFRLKQKGVKIAFIQLHTGLSYFLNDYKTMNPAEHYEQYTVPMETMEMIQEAKTSGKRVIAVGTTVVRALETVKKSNQLSGWSNLYVHRGFSLQVVDGILTGFHEPEASHLDMLTAFVKERHLFNAYEKAMEKKYLWHEFGDMNLIL